MTLAIDQTGLELIAGFEGYRDVVYPDSRGFATVGVGHLLHQSAPTQADHAHWDHKRRAFYLNLLRQDVERVAMGPIRSMVGNASLNQHQVDALASACFNCGPGFIYGTVGKDIRAGRLGAAADAFLLWQHPPELAPRRHAERVLFLSPVPHLALPWLTVAERRWCLEYDRLLHAKKNLRRRRVLRRYMHAEAVKIQSAARRGGWERANRRHRYASLVARSTD